MKDLRDLTDWTIYDVKPISDAKIAGRRHCQSASEQEISVNPKKTILKRGDAFQWSW